MIRKMVLSLALVMVLSISIFSSRAAAASAVYFFTEANCSSFTVVLGGYTNPDKLGCGVPIGFSAPAGSYSWTATGCGLSTSGAITVDGTSRKDVLICPGSGATCCSTGAGTGGAFLCPQCSSATTTTTTSATTTTTSATTTTTIPSSTSALFVKNASGTEVFSVSSSGSIASASRLLSNGASAWGSAPFVLGQDAGNRGIIVTDKAASNPKNIYFGWNVGTTHEYAEIFAIQEKVGYKNLILNPNGAYVGIRTTSPSHPLHMGSGAYVSTGGVWTNASSREYKTDVKQLSAEKAMDALTQLKPVEFAYKADSQEKHVGFIAEDAPDIVATKDRKGMSPMDVVAVLTKVVQEQQELLREQRKISQEQEKTIGELSEKVAELEIKLNEK